MTFKAVGVCLLFVLILMLATTSPTKSDETSLRRTQHLLAMCKEPAGTAARSYCTGYVMGMADMMGMVGVLTTGDTKHLYGICTSGPGPSGNAEVQVFINWAEKNPKEWDALDTGSVIYALSDTWPCDRTKAAK